MKASKNSSAIAGKLSTDHIVDSNGINNLISILEDNLSSTQLLQKLPVAIYTCNAKGQITFYNEAAALMWGRHPEIGKDLWCGSWKIYNADNTPMPLDDCPMAITLKKGLPIDGNEIIVERPDGKKINVLPHPRPLFDQSGNLSGAVNMLLDITDIKRNEELRQSEERHHRMISEVQDYAIILLNKEGIIENWNKGAEQIKGYKPEEIIGRNFSVFYTEEDRRARLPEQLIELARREGKALHEGWRVKKDGSKFWGSIVITALHDSDNNVIGFSKVTRDLSEKKKSEVKLQAKNEELLNTNEALRRSEERYHLMVSEVLDYAIILLNEQGIIENWNKGAERIKGYSASEVIGKNFSIFYTEEDLKSNLPQKLIERARLEGKANHEGWRVRKDGTNFWGSTVITCLHDEQGNIMGFSKVTRDLSAQKMAEMELQEKNRELEAMNQELASFAYVSSHDLQEPLRKIQTFASRILETENENLSERGKDYFQRMQNAALRMQTLIEDLLTYSRTNTADKNLELTDLNSLLEDIRNEMREAIEEKKAVITASPLPKLEIVPFQFRQLLINILGNALKFSKADTPPAITITADIVRGNSINNSHVVRGRNYHHIAIADNGIGFEPEHSHRIFEVFQRLHGRNEYGGTGIGLAICKKIMDNHGGIITAVSELDRGATFHLYFPVK